jgi:hypothetical protein
MNTRLLSVILPVAFLLGACASDKPAAKQVGEQQQTSGKRDGIFFKKRPSWWNGNFKPERDLPAFRGLKKGRGVLSGDDGELTIYSEPTRGSADPNKPEKVRR